MGISVSHAMERANAVTVTEQAIAQKARWTTTTVALFAESAQANARFAKGAGWDDGPHTRPKRQ